MGHMSGGGGQITVFGSRIGMTVADEVLNAICDGLAQAVGVPRQLILADEAPLALSVELEDGCEVTNKGLQPAALAPVVADEVGDDFFFGR